MLAGNKALSLYTLEYKRCNVTPYTLCSKKSDAKIQITITTAYLIRIKYPLSGFIYCVFFIFLFFCISFLMLPFLVNKRCI